MDLCIRRAGVEDYSAFARFFPELMVDDPIPGPETWASVIAPSTWLAVREGEVVGYCYFEEYVDSGYVRSVVVAPTARRSGVGSQLMRATAEHLRSQGKTSWRLNVRPSNQAAVALYRALQMRTKYVATSLRLPWAALPALPAGAAGVQTLAPGRDAQLERQFDLPKGQLASARDKGRLLFEATSVADGTSEGLAVFDPKFPGAFPFRVAAVDAVTPLLNAMRHYVPTDEHINLVAEDDERLATLLVRAGAHIKDEILHMQGAL